MDGCRALAVTGIVVVGAGWTLDRPLAVGRATDPRLLTRSDLPVERCPTDLAAEIDGTCRTDVVCLVVRAGGGTTALGVADVWVVGVDAGAVAVLAAGDGEGSGAAVSKSGGAWLATEGPMRRDPLADPSESIGRG